MTDSSGMIRMHCVGVDVSKATFDAALAEVSLAGTGAEAAALPAVRFERTAQGARRLAEWVGKRVEAQAPVRVVMEATGRFSEELAQWLHQADARLVPVIVNPHAAKKHRESLHLRNNTDTLAARALALYGLERQPQPQQPMSDAHRELRELSRWRDHLVGERTAILNRLKEPAASALVRKREAQHRRCLDKEIERLEACIKKHIHANAELARDFELLITIGGVGFITAVVILAELGDLRRFQKARQLTAYTGLSPEHNQSGTSVNHRPRLSNKGNKRARQGLYLAALAAIRATGPFHHHYHHLISQGKTKMAAMAAVMRKLLVLMRALLIGETSYDPQHPHRGKPCGIPVHG